jgi:hydrogenase maturation protease
MTAAGCNVVIGVGNVLLGDDGAGVRALEALRSEAAREPGTVPPATRLVDGGTLGVDLLVEMEGARSLLLIDAVDLGQPAGTVSVLRGEAILDAGTGSGRCAPVGVSGLLSVARLAGCLPGPIALVGVQVDEMNLGAGLSGRVAAALPRAVEVARDVLRELDALAALAGGSRGVASHVERASA